MILDGQNVLKKHLFQNFQHVRSSWYNQEKKNLYDFYSSIDDRLPKKFHSNYIVRCL